MAHVTIPDQDTFVTYTVTNSTTGPFNIPFAIFAKADLVVLKDGVDLGQAAFSYTPTSSTTGGYQTGEITLGSVVEDCQIAIYRSILPVRTSDMGPGPKDRDADNTQWDRFQAQLQDSRRDLSRALKGPLGLNQDALQAPSENKFIAQSTTGRFFHAVAAVTGVAASALFTAAAGATTPAEISALFGYRLSIEPDQAAYGGVADGGTTQTDNAAALVAAVAAAKLIPGCGVWIGDGKSYAFGSRVELQDYTGFTGDGTGELVMLTSAGKFDNTDGTISGRYAADAVGIYATGKAKVFVEKVKIRTSAAVDGQCIRPIYFTGCDDARVEACDITGFTEAELISFNTCDRMKVLWNRIHDCEYDYAAIRRQLTGIGVDNDVGSSSDIVLMFNVIENLTASAAVISAWGYETDGINIVRQGTTGIAAFNTIRFCGEGIDSFGKVHVRSNTIEDMYIYGVKKTHGASLCDITDNTILRPGLAGINVNYSTIYSFNAERITIRGNSIREVDPNLLWNTDSAGILLVAGASTYGLRKILVTQNDIDCGTNGEYGIKCTGTNTGGSVTIANDNYIINAQTTPIFSPDYTFELGEPVQRVFRGCTLSNNATDATNDIDISYGMVTDSTGTRVIRLNQNITKQLDAAWAAGTNAGMRDTGSIANDTWHIWLILNPTTMAVDVLASLSASAPTMPSGFTFKAYLGAIIRVSSAIVAFSQLDDEFLLKVPVSNTNTSNPGTSAVLTTLRVPTGVKVQALTQIKLLDISPAGSVQAIITSPDQDDTDATTYTIVSMATAAVGAGLDYVASGNFRTRTDTSGRIRYRINSSDADISVNISTMGWVDPRGRMAA